jgi:hypothetical protein
MKPIIRSVGVWGHPNIRTWSPDNPECFAEVVSLDIGPKPGKGADSFNIRVASPAGLATLDAKDGIVAGRPLLVMQRYDYDSLWRWLEGKVAVCEAETWPACVEKLRRYFDWEYDNYSSK